MTISKNYPKKFYDIQLETIAPVSIGNSELLSPYTDYVFADERKKIHLVDKNAIEQTIFEIDEQKEGKEQSLMDEYIHLIHNSFDNNRSGFKLKEFLESPDYLGMSSNDYATQTISFEGLNPNYRQEIKCTTKNNEHPYIPGSTIKGAIKAAILYAWLTDEKQHGMVDRMMRKVLNTFDKSEQDIDIIERISGKNYKSREDWTEIRNRRRNIERYHGGKDLANLFDSTIEELLTKDHKKISRDFTKLSVTDTGNFSKEDLIIQLTNRLHYNKGVVSIPANLEAIAPNNNQFFKIGIDANFYHENLKFLNESQPIEALFKKINKFHEDNLDMELELLDSRDWYKHARPRERQIFDRYQRFLEARYDDIKNALPHEAYLCLGFGKSFFYNSIGMLVYDWSDERTSNDTERLTPFQKYCKLFSIGRDGQKLFPATRSVTIPSGMAMGWVKLIWKNN